MKKTFTILLFVITTFSLHAQQDTAAVALGEVMVLENRIQIPFNKVSRNISIINRKELETTPARSLQEVLAFTPGVDVRQRGVSGVQANIGIRGGNSEQTLMLLNGIKLTDPQSGNFMMNIPLPLQAIQRVEVLKGPGSRIFGQNAYAGAINVITELSTERTLSFQAFGGDFGMRGANLVTSLPIGNYKQTLSVSHDGSDGHWYNSDFKVSNIFYEGGVDINQSNEIKILAGYTDRTFGANGFYTNSFPDQWESIQTTLAALTHNYRQNNLFIQSRAYWRRNVDEFRLRRNEPEFFTNNHVTDVFALEFNGTYTSDFGISGFGIEGRQEEIDSNNLGQRQRTFAGIFAEHRIEFAEKFDFRVGLYSNYFDEYGWKHFPGAELGYQINRLSRLYANYGKSFRIPSFNELYYEDPSNVSNPNLLPEEAQSFEIGYKLMKNRFSAEAVLFNRTSKNLIDWTRAPSTESPNPNRWTPNNISQVSFNGVETGFKYGLKLGGANARLNEISFSYNYIHADLQQAEGIESRFSLNSLRHQLIGGLQAEFSQKIEWTLKARYIERIALDPYFLLDTRVDYNRLGVVGLFAEISNITNADYVEAGFVQMPGRWFRAGLMVNIN